MAQPLRWFRVYREFDDVEVAGPYECRTHLQAVTRYLKDVLRDSSKRSYYYSLLTEAPETPPVVTEPKSLPLSQQRQQAYPICPGCKSSYPTYRVGVACPNGCDED